jgi:hypothetical protein
MCWWLYKKRIGKAIKNFSLKNTQDNLLLYKGKILWKYHKNVTTKSRMEKGYSVD